MADPQVTVTDLFHNLPPGQYQLYIALKDAAGHHILSSKHVNFTMPASDAPASGQPMTQETPQVQTA